VSKLTLQWNSELFNNKNNYGSGMLFDLAGGKINAYDFTLKGESSGSYPGSFI